MKISRHFLMKISLHFFLDEKTQQKNQGLVCFRCLYLSIPKQNKLAVAQTTFVFNGIVCVKLAAKKNKAGFIRLIAVCYSRPYLPLKGSPGMASDHSKTTG